MTPKQLPVPATPQGKTQQWPRVSLMAKSKPLGQAQRQQFCQNMNENIDQPLMLGTINNAIFGASGGSSLSLAYGRSQACGARSQDTRKLAISPTADEQAAFVELAALTLLTQARFPRRYTTIIAY